MNRILLTHIRGALAAALGVLLSLQEAQAILGSDEKALAALPATLAPRAERVRSFEAFMVHEYDVGPGVVRAYVSPKGRVFAFTGHEQLTYPDPVLLGPYFKEFQAETERFQAESTATGRRPLAIRTPNIAAGVSGFQSHLHWFVFLVNELPPGVSENDIR